GGNRLTPVIIEFWQVRDDRLADRIRYTDQPNQTRKTERLSP
ncbi:MAG: pyridoxine 5'-phosphate oxidase C-terminal domain-containing protein, partial [Calditrichaceae bacterium]